MPSVYVGRHTTIIAKAKTDSELEIRAGNRRFKALLSAGEILKFRGYIDFITWDGSVELSYFDSDVDVNIQVSSSGIISELQLLAKETTLQSALAELQTANTTLSAIDSKLAQPTEIHSSEITIDNSAGTADLVQPLFSTSTPSKTAALRRVSSGVGDTVPIYLGGAAETPALSLGVGDTIQLSINDLSKVYVRVPAGVTAKLQVIWEV